jgi:accessory gene regulator B
MGSKFSERVADSLVNTGAAPAEDKALYEYGIRQGIFLVINIATAVLIGLFIGMLWQCIIFLIAYNPVRSYAGGYHARTPLACYLLSIPTITAVLVAIKLLPWSGFVCAFILFCSTMVIGFLAPVADPNKPLNEREISAYKSRARAYSAVLTGAAIMLWWAGMTQISITIIMALGFAAVMLILGAVKNGNKQIEKA